jgi:hypothetical protein
MVAQGGSFADINWKSAITAGTSDFTLPACSSDSSLGSSYFDSSSPGSSVGTPVSPNPQTPVDFPAASKSHQGLGNIVSRLNTILLNHN